ncbi:hypothetical protein EDD21DRAFT_116176 [Dissophora ornata]|nr:hypothetical protein EDD21DRAFT_116176 [Dissophora ornata]
MCVSSHAFPARRLHSFLFLFLFSSCPVLSHTSCIIPCTLHASPFWTNCHLILILRPKTDSWRQAKGPSQFPSHHHTITPSHHHTIT